MRYTRNQQIYKLGIYGKTKIIGNLKISHMRKVKEELDPNFIWYRTSLNGNVVSFYRKGEAFRTFVIKGRN